MLMNRPSGRKRSSATNLDCGAGTTNIQVMENETEIFRLVQGLY